MNRLRWILELCLVLLLTCLYMAFDGLRMALRRSQVRWQLWQFRRKFR
jgi:hypothetical protein